jgi:hypothetical protein
MCYFHLPFFLLPFLNEGFHIVDEMYSCYLPPVAVEQLLVEDGSVGAEEGHRVQRLRVHRVLQHMYSYALLYRGI